MEDWEKKYFAIRAQQKQQQNSSREDQVKNLKSGLDWKEADISSFLTNKLISQNVNQNNSNAVHLKEGYEYYKVINSQNFGHSIPLVRNMGTLSNVNNIEFVIMEEIKVFCVDNMNVVDLSKINEQPEKYLTLIKVRSALNGDLLVNKSAIVEYSFINGCKQILKD